MQYAPHAERIRAAWLANPIAKVADIAAQVGCSEPAASQHRRVLVSQGLLAQSVHQRGGKPRRLDLVIVNGLREQGMAWIDIAAKVGCSETHVRKCWRAQQMQQPTVPETSVAHQPREVVIPVALPRLPTLSLKMTDAEYSAVESLRMRGYRHVPVLDLLSQVRGAAHVRQRATS